MASEAIGCSPETAARYWHKYIPDWKEHYTRANGKRPHDDAMRLYNHYRDNPAEFQAIIAEKDGKLLEVTKHLRVPLSSISKLARELGMDFVTYKPGPGNHPWHKFGQSLCRPAVRDDLMTLDEAHELDEDQNWTEQILGG
jgi:hypothetical protein